MKRGDIGPSFSLVNIESNLYNKSMAKSIQIVMGEWTHQAFGAGLRLMKLYAQLGDDKQRQRAVQTFDAARERIEQSKYTSANNQDYLEIDPANSESELAAWREAIEATTGILILLTLARDSGKSFTGLRGQISKFAKASHEALEGLKCALPEDFAKEGTKQAMEKVMEDCRIAFDESFSEDLGEKVLNDILISIREALRNHLGA